MANKPIVDEHHVVRHCKKRLLIRKNGITVGVQPDAFELRPATKERKQETYLSALYYEFLEGNHSEKMRGCLAALAFKPRENDGLFKLNVGKIRAQGVKRSVAIRVLHMPKRECASYSGIHGIPMPADGTLNSLLATLSFIDAMEVSEILNAPKNGDGAV